MHVRPDTCRWPLPASLGVLPLICGLMICYALVVGAIVPSARRASITDALIAISFTRLVVRRCHHDGVLVFTRSPTGEWIPWRVGRQRLAWRPVPRAPWRATVYDPDRLNPFKPVYWHEGFDILNMVGALLATLVVWPWRAVTNRWPVIAYVPDDPEGNIQMHRTPPMRRAQAKAVARDWAEHIRRYGEPPAQ